jgi:hypothetical protein
VYKFILNALEIASIYFEDFYVNFSQRFPQVSAISKESCYTGHLAQERPSLRERWPRRSIRENPYSSMAQRSWTSTSEKRNEISEISLSQPRRSGLRGGQSRNCMLLYSMSSTPLRRREDHSAVRDVMYGHSNKILQSAPDFPVALDFTISPQLL